MEYRTLPHGGERFSVMGLGLGSISEITDATTMMVITLSSVSTV